MERNAALLRSSIYVDPWRVSATVLLARHGCHDDVGLVLSGRSPIGLNAAGVGDAERLAKHVAGAQLDRICSSPQPRARQTAAPAAARHGLPVEVLDGVDEIDFGRWAGMPFAALAGDQAWHEWNAARDTAATPAGETMAAVVVRAKAAIAAVATVGCTLIVSHCDVIRGVVADLLGVSLARLFAFEIDCGGVTTLRIDGGDWRLVSLNERPR